MVQKLPASSNSRFRPSLRAKGVIIFVVVVVRRDQPTFSPPFVFLSLLSACYDDRERERERFEQSVVVLHSRVVILGARKKDEAFASTKKKKRKEFSRRQGQKEEEVRTRRRQILMAAQKKALLLLSKQSQKRHSRRVFVVRSLLFYLIERSKKKHTLLFKWSRLVQKSLVHSLSFKKEYSTHISTSINRAHIKKREN